MPRLTSNIGMPVGLNDMHGNPVHIGDTLRFDEEEWGAPHKFVLTMEKGELSISAPCEITEWCEILRKFDGEPI